MGASGVKIFDDDLAADIRDLYREHLKYGKSNEKATALLQEQFEEVLGSEEESVFYLALANVQWEYGNLEAPIRQRALEIIANGSDLQRWNDDPKLAKQRQKILETLAETLNTTNPKPKKVTRKKEPLRSPWETGDVFAYRMENGQYILLRVIAVHRYHYDEHVVCELLDWIGTAIPQKEFVVELPIRRNNRYPSESMFYFPLLKKYLARCQTLDVRLQPTLIDDGSYMLPIDYNKLSNELQEYFGLAPSQKTTL